MEQTRKVLWIAGAIPKDITQDKYDATVEKLSLSIGGELVRFGDNSWVIIGDSAAEIRYTALVSEGVNAGKIPA